MAEPNIAQKAPYKVDLKEGEQYWWCACGLSKSQPFCDGSHKTTEFRPLQYKATETKEAWLCGCKQSASTPFCDGTHRKL
ncbi:MAG TPA: CDGSH iron-sulfur domain-containing protein [Magnetospirillaceae bacterium]|jgi:CDGSH-type Zn-finger protein